MQLPSGGLNLTNWVEHEWNFISIQHSSGTFAKGYEVMPLQTGYERIIPHRVDELFAVTAKKKGRVTSVNDKAISVEYDDGSKMAYELGRRFGVAAGATYPHEVKTIMTEGQEFDVGDCITYNSRYFKLDPLNPKEALWKIGAMVKTALLECPDTLEDSSVISEEVAGQMETEITKVREITVAFDQVIHNLIEVGTSTDVDSILCTIEDAVTAQSKLFNDNSIDTLRLLAANTPKAKFKGQVERIEVFYNGEFDDLSEPLQRLAQASDNARKRQARQLGVRYTSGRVDGGLRIDGNSLPFNHAVIRIYITGPVSASIGDKFVFGNQLKTIVGRVMTGVNKTESGVPLGALFGAVSVDARIVQSPIIMGTTITLLKVISKRVAEVYRTAK